MVKKVRKEDDKKLTAMDIFLQAKSEENKERESKENLSTKREIGKFHKKMKKARFQ